jgi:hypothetical protein
LAGISALAQALIAIRWRALDSKTSFANQQRENAFVLCLGREDQRAIAMAGNPLVQS